MGGHAFATAGPNGSALNVPRMSTATYQALSSEVQRKLQTVFRNVAFPREGIWKADHGDIDVLVEGAMTQWDPDTLKELLGAEYLNDSGGTKSYAVPYADSPGQYYQVDVQICPGEGTPDSDDLFKWTLFFKSDSDLLQIIGVCHRSLGLSCNDKGFYLRVREIEPWQKGFLLLTRDPDEAMQFYGLDNAKYWEGFYSQEELFEWVTNSRFFHPGTFDGRHERAKDRARLRKRPMYSRFIEHYMPRRLAKGTRNWLWSREHVREEALDTFGKHKEYEEMMAEYSARERDAALWDRVKELLPVQGKSLTTALRSLRRWVDFDDGQPFVTSEAIRDQDQPLWGASVVDEEAFLSWVKKNWEQVRRLEKARVNGVRKANRDKSHTGAETSRLQTDVEETNGVDTNGPASGDVTTAAVKRDEACTDNLTTCGLESDGDQVNGIDGDEIGTSASLADGVHKTEVETNGPETDNGPVCAWNASNETRGDSFEDMKETEEDILNACKRCSVLHILTHVNDGAFEKAEQDRRQCLWYTVHSQPVVPVSHDVIPAKPTIS